MSPRLEPYEHPAAWKASGVRGKDTFAVDLTNKHLDALLRAVRQLKQRGVTEFDAIGREDFDLADIADDVEAWQRALSDGKGLLILRGFPVDDVPSDEIELMWFCLLYTSPSPRDQRGSRMPSSA